MNQYQILLVEDDAEISEMLKSCLKAENYEVICAFDGQEACAKFDAFPVHLVLLDLMIPKISGMDVMQHIRKSSVVPLIILSQRIRRATRRWAWGWGRTITLQSPSRWRRFWRGSGRLCAGQTSMTRRRIRARPS